MSIYPEKTIKEVLSHLESDAVLDAIDYRTDTIQRIRDTVKCFCPIHKEQVFRTLIVSPKDKTYRCSYSLCPGNKGGDLISLYSLAKEMDYDQGLAELVEVLNLTIELPTTQEFIDKTVEVAENYLELGVLDEAEQGFTKIVEIQSNNIDAHKGLLEIYTLQKNEELIIQGLKNVVRLLISNREYESAMNYGNQLVEKKPESKEVHNYMVDCYLGLEDFNSALGEYMNLADLYEEDGEFDDALNIYHKIENLGLDIIDIYPHIINVLVASNRTEEAIQETIKRAENFKAAKEYEKTLDCYKYILELDETRNDIRKMYIELALEIGLTDSSIDESLRIIDEILAQHALGEALDALNSLLSAMPYDTKIIKKMIGVYIDQGREEEAEVLQLRISDLYDDAGNFDEAMAPLQVILENKPESIEALSRISAIYYKLDDRKKSIETYQTIIGIFHKNKEIDKAITTYDRLISIAPDDIEFKDRQIKLYIEAERKDEAFQKALSLVDYLEQKKKNELLIEKIRFALTLNPVADSLIIRLADILFRLKRVYEARDEYFHAYEVLRDMKKLDNAASQLLRCLDIDQEDRKALFALGETFMEIGDFRKALQHFKKLATILLDEKNLEEGEKVLQKIISIQPDDINTLNQLVSMYKQLGYENEVVDTYEKINNLYLQKEAFNKVIEICHEILEIRPENIAAHEKLINVYENTNRQNDAILLLFKMADIYEKNENLAREEECYQSILKKDNGNVDARRRQVFLLLKLSRKQPAHKEARILSDQYTMRSQPELAIKLYRKLLESDPDELPLNLHLLELYKKVDDKEKIISQIECLIKIYSERDQMVQVVDYYREILLFDSEKIEIRTSLIKALLQLERNDEAMHQSLELADLHLNYQCVEDAETVFEDMLEIQPENQLVYRKLIDLNRERGTMDKAIELINKLSDIQHKVGQSELAIDTLKEVFNFDALNIENHRRIINLQKESGLIDDAIEMSLTLYDLFNNTGNLEEGITTLKETIELKPEDTVLRKKLADAHINTGEVQEAIQELFRIYEIHIKQESYEEALNTLAEVLENDSGSLQARKRRAETYALMGDEKKALAEFMKLSSDLDSGRIASAAGPVIQAPASEMEELPIVEEYTFDCFVVGSRNNFAYATAMAVAKAPAQNYNPLFLCSDVGLGKTHLIHAIANYIKKNRPELKILYTNSEEFTTQLIEAIQNNNMLQFRARHKNTDLLLLDDVQFLAGKERAQEEFFHLFNALFQAKKQIVITSDRPPKDIAHLEKRLRSRFGAGIIVDIQPPDMVTRAAILKKERDHMTDADVSDHIISIIAEKVDTNIRDLKGAFNQIVARHRITNQPITEEIVHRVLESLFEKV
jgi:chromosomal replication initiator protein DnaA